MSKIIAISRNLRMPFLPMQPSEGRSLRTRRLVNSLWKEIESDTWVAQPLLQGTRACLAVQKRRVHLQDGTGTFLRLRLENAKDFLNLPDGTCFDGEIFKRNFYPFEALAFEGQSVMEMTAMERVVLAKSAADRLGHAWLFPPLNYDWLVRRKSNLPLYRGVILKCGIYRVRSNRRQVSLDWVKRLW